MASTNPFGLLLRHRAHLSRVRSITPRDAYHRRRWGSGPAETYTRDETRTRKAIGRGILSPLRLPIPPPGRTVNLAIRNEKSSRSELSRADTTVSDGRLPNFYGRRLTAGRRRELIPSRWPSPF